MKSEVVLEWEEIVLADQMNLHATLATGMRFDITTGSEHQIVLDTAVQSGGQDEGPRPMEMLLVALAGCTGMGVVSILRKMRQNISTYEVAISAEQAEVRPNVFTSINVEHILTGHEIQPAAIERAIELTEKHYCGVSKMLEKTAKIIHTFRIIDI